MTRQPRRNHSPAFKAKVALAAVRGEQTLSELAQQYDVHANLIKQWRDQLLEGAMNVFDAGKSAHSEEPVVDAKTLHAKIGELTLENDFCPVRSERPGDYRAQRNDRPGSQTANQAPGAPFRHQSWQRLLSAASCAGG